MLERLWKLPGGVQLMTVGLILMLSSVIPVLHLGPQGTWITAYSSLYFIGLAILAGGGSFYYLYRKAVRTESDHTRLVEQNTNQQSDDFVLIAYREVLEALSALRQAGEKFVWEASDPQQLISQSIDKAMTEAQEHASDIIEAKRDMTGICFADAARKIWERWSQIRYPIDLGEFVDNKFEVSLDDLHDALVATMPKSYQNRLAPGRKKLEKST